MIDRAGVIRFHKKLFHVLWQAVLGFQKDQCALRASALSLYTLLAIVPVMAMAFGIAKGFGFQKFLEAEVMSLFAGREEIISKVLAFSNNLLERTKGGLMAVFGIILLLYSLIKLMSHMEATFNRIWWDSGNRPLLRKITDYLTISLAAGVLVLFSGSVNIFMAGQMQAIFTWFNLPTAVGRMVSLGGGIFPFLSTWLLFMFCYVIIPNTRINIRAAAAGSIIAGSLFQLIQIAYLHFQVGVSSYNAIYGSFAALPLFLVWLQTSWLALLYGAEIAYAWENLDSGHAGNLTWKAASMRLKKILVLRVVRICVRRFADKVLPASDLDIARELSLPLHLVRQLLEILVRAQILYEVAQGAGPSSRAGYTPASDIECLSIMDVLTAVEQTGALEKGLDASLESEAFEDSLEAFDTAARASKGERKIKDI